MIIFENELENGYLKLSTKEGPRELGKEPKIKILKNMERIKIEH